MRFPERFFSRYVNWLSEAITLYVTWLETEVTLSSFFCASLDYFGLRGEIFNNFGHILFDPYLLVPLIIFLDALRRKLQFHFALKRKSLF